MEMLRAQEASGNANKAKLFQKLVNVLRAVESVPKSGYNKFQDYHYATEADVMEVVRRELIKNNLFIFTSSNLKQVDTRTDKDGKTSFITTVVTEHVIGDAETGATHTVFSSGQGHDSLDKGIFKAITGANKYFLQKTFMISGEDDPENDGVTASAPSVQRTGFSRPAASTNSKSPATTITTTPNKTTSTAPVAPKATATVTPIKQQIATPAAPAASKPAASTPVRRSFSRAPVQATPTQSDDVQDGTNVDEIVEAEAADSTVRF